MSLRATGLNDEVRKYVLEKAVKEPLILRQIREENFEHNQAHQQIAEEQAQFMTLLLKAMNAKLALELGVYFGYSAIAIMNGLANDGQLIACEKNPEYAKVAQRYFDRAGLSGRIDLRIAPAMSTIDNLLNSGFAGKFDFIFIDADKGNYLKYYELSLALIRKGGLIAIDNVLWYGRILDNQDQSKITNTIREFNDKIQSDSRVDISLVTIGDGMTLALKR